jgi:uncharacterized protein YcaQ
VPATIPVGESLTPSEAVRIALFAQGLRGPRVAGGAPGVLARLRGVQIDTISVLARSHELVAFARLGAVSRSVLAAAYWGPTAETFEYWSHAACVLPLELWPAYGLKRRALRERSRASGDRERRREESALLARLAEGPLTARELGGAKRGGQWWDWSPVKTTAESLLADGVLVCRTRRGFERVYDLAERAIPAELRELELDDAAGARALVESAGGALGVATVADLAAYHGLSQARVRAVVGDTALAPVRVAGWREGAYLAPGAEAALEPGRRGRTVMLSPFDSLLWDRRRLERLFSITYRLECYVPAPRRVVGYYAMPVLAGERLVALVDPRRDGATLRAEHVVLLDERASASVAAALAEAATWVGCSSVTVARVTPAGAAPAVRAAVRALSSPG